MVVWNNVVDASSFNILASEDDELCKTLDCIEGGLPYDLNALPILRNLVVPHRRSDVPYTGWPSWGVILNEQGSLALCCTLKISFDTLWFIGEGISSRTVK